MTVTEITEVSKSRSKVYLDQEFAFVLYKGELRLYHIREGAELAQEAYHEILHEVLPKRAKLRSMNLLKSREYTEEQLRRKLREGFYPEEVIAEAIEYVASYHYIDDLRYAISFMTSYEGSRSRRRIEQDLQGKGISRETIRKAWTMWEEQGGSQDEAAMIRRLLEKKHFDPESSDRKEQQKIYGFLMRKGYSADQIRKAMRPSQEYD